MYKVIDFIAGWSSSFLALLGFTILGIAAYRSFSQEGREYTTRYEEARKKAEHSVPGWEFECRWGSETK